MISSTCKKNFKNLLVNNYWSDFKMIWYKWSFGDPLYQSCSNYFEWFKNMATIAEVVARVFFAFVNIGNLVVERETTLAVGID